MNKNLVLLVIMVLILFISGCSSEDPGTVDEKAQGPILKTSEPQSNSEDIPEPKMQTGDFPQKFHTEEKNIVDAEGNNVRLRGVNALDPLAQATWGEKALGEWNEEYFKSMKEFGSEIVRIPIHPEMWRDTDKRFEILDKTIEWIGNQKMYAIIDYHSIGFLPENTYEEKVYKTTKDEIKEFWRTIATRYKNNDVLAFYDIFNEPVNLKSDADEYNPSTSANDWAKWKIDAEEIIDVIREIDEDSVIIVGGLHWSYDLTQVLENPVNRDNIIYGVHPYPGKTDYLSWEDAFGKAAKQYPVFAGEIGFWSEEEIRELAADSQADSDTWNPTYIEKSYEQGLYREDIANFLNENNIGWTAWHFSPAWGPVLLKNWDYELTEAGTFFSEQLTK